MKPDKIKVKFTEEDRQSAGPYNYNGGCLLATALKRMGFKKVSVGGLGRCSIDGREYEPVQSFNSNVEIDDATEAPYYHPTVVGKTIILVS